MEEEKEGEKYCLNFIYYFRLLGRRRKKKTACGIVRFLAYRHVVPQMREWKSIKMEKQPLRGKFSTITRHRDCIWNARPLSYPTKITNCRQKKTSGHKGCPLSYVHLARFFFGLHSIYIDCPDQSDNLEAAEQVKIYRDSYASWCLKSSTSATGTTVCIRNGGDAKSWEKMNGQSLFFHLFF